LLIADPQGADATLDLVAKGLRRYAGPSPVLLYTDVLTAKQAESLGFYFLSKHDSDNDTLLQTVRQLINHARVIKP
jgi:hypothetical protein